MLCSLLQVPLLRALKSTQMPMFHNTIHQVFVQRGVGRESGIGRIGGMLGPTLGGFLLSSQLPFHINFLSFAIPSILEP